MIMQNVRSFGRRLVDQVKAPSWSLVIRLMLVAVMAYIAIDLYQQQRPQMVSPCANGDPTCMEESTLSANP
jgi:hypothetical protein